MIFDLHLSRERIIYLPEKKGEYQSSKESSKGDQIAKWSCLRGKNFFESLPKKKKPKPVFPKEANSLPHVHLMT